MDFTTADFAKYTCKCGKEFQCYHKFNHGEIFSNHCLKCGKGADYDRCEGVCPDCFKAETDELEAKLQAEIKFYAEHCME